MTEKNTAQWDAGRFVKTLAYFGPVPFIGSISWLQQLFGSSSNNKKETPKLVLVAGATGGVGSVACGILAKAGYDVVASTGKTDQKDFLTGLGVKEIIGREEATDTSGRPLLKARWAGVVDTVGGEILATAIKSAKQHGVVTCCGNVASAELPINVYPFILRGVSLVGIDSAYCPMDIRKRVWAKIAGEWKIEKLDSIATEISLAGLDEHIDLILRGKEKGRVIVNLTK